MRIPFVINHPTAVVARGIENLSIREQNSRNLIIKVGCGGLARVISVTAFPIFLTLELVFKHIPKFLLAIRFCNKTEITNKKFSKRIDKISKFSLGIFCSPLGLRSPGWVSGLFLKAPDSKKMVRPFGVEGEDLFGKKVDAVYFPKSINEVQDLVKQAKRENKRISVIGAGMSQGTQTVPNNRDDIVINTKYLNQIQFNTNTVKVGAGATWEQMQLQADARGKSAIVKQASDVFSIGGSIGINCHGWAHEYGAISSTVESLEIIDANGDLKTLTPDDEQFKCMFGTLGYFGVIVSATLKLENNENLVETTVEVDLNEFIQHYKDNVKGKDVPLFGGRLVLDNLDGNPLRKICMVSYKKTQLCSQFINTKIQEEANYGLRMERMALQLINHLSYYSSRRILSYFWSKERQAMLSQRKVTRNEALHPPIKSFNILHHSNLHTQWLQEYFIKEEHLSNFLRFLGAQLKANDVRLINATIRPTPKDNVSILPYAEQDRYAVVICFSQLKTKTEIEKTKQWITTVNEYLVNQGDVYYQAYMPYATQEQFEKCYGADRIAKMRALKHQFDPDNRFSNAHTRKYFDLNNPKEANV